MCLALPLSVSLVPSTLVLFGLAPSLLIGCLTFICEFGTQYSGAIWSATQSVTTLVGFELTVARDSAT